MKLAYIQLCGFRGYGKALHIDFPEGFTIIDGRNGVGKSTIFDAVEFALTGTITKYGDVKVDRETVADYIWWRGEGTTPVDYYVEVGFRDGDNIVSVRRTQVGGSDSPTTISTLEDLLCDARIAPKSPLPQLCLTSIIRDEHIAALSLDLKETERYSLLCDAIGATDADIWIERGKSLANFSERRQQIARRDVELAAKDAVAAGRRIDEIRAALIEETTIASAASRLQSYTGSTAPLDQLIGPAREAIAENSRRLEELVSLEVAWQEAAADRERLPGLRQAVLVARAAKTQADESYEAITEKHDSVTGATALAQQARDISALVALGRKLGLHDGHCPLCASQRTSSEFANGLTLAERYARRLDVQAFEQAERERARTAAAAAAERATAELIHRETVLLQLETTLSDFETRLANAGLILGAGLKELHETQGRLRAGLDSAREDLRIIETLRLNIGLEKAIHEETKAKESYERAEARLGLARRAESRAKALHDAARRAAGETLDRRLDRVLPLMVELYRRLRPHPVWSDIEHKIRGDVKRFLKLQIGDELNPQFIFSSGQRRATGLAFLLSVNLSLAWSRWRTILLDDPVQHVDDFRSIHLAEVMAQLSAEGRQIICAVEDSALADLLCRRLPIEKEREGKRVTLGPDSEGTLAKLEERDLVPLPQRTLVTEPLHLAG